MSALRLLVLEALDLAERDPEIARRLAAVVASVGAPSLTDWIGLDDIERAYGISKRTSRRWVSEGKLSAQKIGRAYRVRRDALEALLAPTTPKIAPTVDDADPALGAALSKARAKTLRKVGR